MGVVSLALVLAASVAQAQDLADYEIGQNDVLRIDVYDMPSLSGEYVVNAQGAVTFPYCGPVQVSGRTPLGAQEAIRTCLLDGVLVDPQVTLRVAAYRSQRVEVRGAVAKPGAYFLEGATTVRAMIGVAGDIKLETSTGVVTVLRGAERYEIRVPDLNGPAGDLLLRDDDVVVVDQGATVLVGGQVAKPGPVAFTDGLTVTEALVRAGDATGFANLAGSYVLRDGEKIEVNLRRIRKGRAADLLLQPGDQIVVPESPL